MKSESVCFICFYAYSGLAKTNHQFAGGAEFQQILLAKELCKKGYDVFFIVGDFGQHKIEKNEGIKVYKAFNPNRANRGLNFFRNMYSLYHSMRENSADTYNFRSDSFYVGPIAFFCKLLKKRFVFSAGIDTNASLSILKTLKWPMPHFYRWGLKVADAIVAQTERQRKQFFSNFGVNSVLIRNCISIENKLQKNRPRYFLWVGTIIARKRPDLCLRIASHFPKEEFWIIGGPGGDGIYEETKKEALELPNVKFIGFVPQKEIYKYFEEAKALICTSESEGFPNTFLQAWSHEVPVISLKIDPDECICTYKLGFHSRNLTQLIKDIEEIIHNEEMRIKLGKNGKKYLAKSHDIRVLADQYIEVFWPSS